MKKYTFIVSFLLCFLYISNVSAADTALEETKELIEDYYVGEIKGNLQSATSIEQLMGMLDEHSVAFTREEYYNFVNAVDSQSVGIGVIIEKHDLGVIINEIFDGGSAQKAGLKSGDIITAVDGIPLVDKTISEASSLITGKVNTDVTLHVQKVSGEMIKITLTRVAFSIPNVTSELLYGNVGYIAFNSFSSSGDREITRAYNHLKAKGATSFILDIRNNTGGYVDTAEKVIGMFPKAEYAYKLIDNTGSTIISANTINQSRAIFPEDTKILINGWSASASDMLAAAVKDQKAALLYGSTTYGKGTMQMIFQVANGQYYIKLTVAEFQSPYGNKIDSVGINPDFPSEIPLQLAHLDTIVSKLNNYKMRPKMENAQPNKEFSIKFNKSVSTKFKADSIELVELGGEKVDIDIHISSNKVNMKPTKPLKNGANYLLIIHPSVKTKHNLNLNTGAYMHITILK